ncbi:MAG: aspartate aminotransferase family protein [Clostridiales bacterium]|nr:aspartate aminotransferase family protein [Clostridiales bacterium]
MTTKELDKKYVVGTYARFDAAIERGTGSTLYDEDGKRYIDFGSGIAVNTFGAADSVWKDAVIKQLDKIQHTSNLYYNENGARLAEMLCEKTGMKKVFFSNSGAEANECAIKTARKYGTDHSPDKNIIITLENSFHGRTVTTLSATGQEVFHQFFTPFTEGFRYIPADADALSEAVDDKVCAVMIETVQGEGGVNVLSEEFLDAVEKITTQRDILLIVDEVQTGNGRTGSLYSYMKFGMTPDIVSTAKGLAGGLPMGATLLGERVENTLGKGMHGSTFGANPVCAAAAISVIERLDEEFLKEVEEKGRYIRTELEKIQGVRSVSGMGLMLGVEIEKKAVDTANECLKNGLLILTAKTKLRIVPPLNISYDEIKQGIEILKGVIEK